MEWLCDRAMLPGPRLERTGLDRVAATASSAGGGWAVSGHKHLVPAADQADAVPPVRVESDPRTNSLIVSGAARIMSVAEGLIRELDLFSSEQAPR